MNVPCGPDTGAARAALVARLATGQRRPFRGSARELVTRCFEPPRLVPLGAAAAAALLALFGLGSRGYTPRQAPIGPDAGSRPTGSRR